MMIKALKLTIKNYFLKRKLIREHKTVNSGTLKLHKKRVLIIDKEIPEFDKDSGSRRLDLFINILLKNEVSVFLMGDLKEYKYRTNYVKKYQDLGVVVYEPSITETGELYTKQRFLEEIVGEITHAWLLRPKIFYKYYPIISKANPNTKIIFDMVDFHHIRYQREYELLGKKKSLKKAKKYLELELRNCENADEIIAVSEDDKNLLENTYKGDTKVSVIGNVHQYKDEKRKSFSERKNLLFVGGFRHSPNGDAVFFLHNEIMPLVWEQHPEIVVDIIGSNSPSEIQKLNSDKFIIHGFVEDISDHFNNSRLFVAPLRYGAGIKGKIGQSLEYGLPLVTTDIGAEGFDFSEYKEIMTANNKEEIAQKIISLYTNEKLWQEISIFSEVILTPFSVRNTEMKIKEVLGIE